MKATISHPYDGVHGDSWKSLVKLYALRHFFRDCIVTDGYIPPKSLSESICLTPAGNEWTKLIASQTANASQAECTVATFLKFRHRELFVDIDETEWKQLLLTLGEEIQRLRIRFPWVYGRDLYDKFQLTGKNRTDSITHEETLRLIEDTPPGVFQLADIVVGPYGALVATCCRLLPPLRSAPLWHCSDPTCQKPHYVKLTSGQTRIAELVSSLEGLCWKKEGPEPGEHPRLTESLGGCDYYDDTNMHGLPWLIANGFSIAELRVILEHLLKKHNVEVKRVYPRETEFAKLFEASPQRIASVLTKSECLQIALLLPDDLIVNCIDYLIAHDRIKVPPTEVRESPFAIRVPCWMATTCQCSRLGVRTSVPSKNISLPRLRRLVWQLYEDSHDQGHLEWHLRWFSGDTLPEKLDNYVKCTDPRDVLERLVLFSEFHVKEAFELLRFGWFDLPRSKAEEKVLIDRILWKLGFDVWVFPEYQQSFWTRYEEFCKAAMTNAPYDENDKLAIRSTGANFFVSLEDILDYSLSFTTWALLSDHYGVTSFRFYRDDARRYTASRLNSFQDQRTDPIVFDEDGRNGLFALISGFSLLARLCHGVISDGHEAHVRPDSDLPGFHDRSELVQFPFVHRSLILDIQEGDQKRITESLARVTRLLSKNQAADVRNRLEHKREDFPSQEEIQKACDAVREAVSEMIQLGLCPTVCVYGGKEEDEFGRITTIYRDQKGNVFRLGQPVRGWGCRLPSPSKPSIIAHCMRAGDSPDPVRFTFAEYSDFDTLWRDYPVRRSLVSDSEDVCDSHGQVSHSPAYDPSSTVQGDT